MTVPVQTHNCINLAAEVVFSTSAAAGVGYFCARAFSLIDPVHAAVFSAATYLVSSIIIPIFEKAFGGWFATDASKITGNILGMGTAIAISSGISTALGFPITFNAGVALSCSIVAVATFVAIAREMTSKSVEVVIT